MDKTLIEMYYQSGLFSDDDLDIFVASKDITADEAKEIRGE